MNINKLLNYRVVEFDKGIVIAPAGARVGMPGAVNLIEAAMPTCCEYLARYTEHRAAGKEPVDAHALALRGANVIAKGDLDRRH